MPSNKKLLQAAAGNAGESLYVEDVFSTYLYDGTATTNNIVNGVDLTEGGLVWIKTRDDVEDHNLVDSERGSNKSLESNTTDAETGSAGFSTFNSDGFTLTGGFGKTNSTSSTYASWTFRKAEKFFDVVTYTGDDVSGREIAHNLGSTPGFMIVKKTSGTYNWQIYHSSIGATKFLEFTNYLAQTSSAVWDDTAPTDSVFTVGNEYGVNQSGDTYVAYLFASDAGGFGDDGDESIIKCGSYDANLGEVVDLGFEPQFIIYKSTANAAWRMADTMRGWTANDTNTIKQLFPNLTNAESDNTFARPTPTGFIINQSGGGQKHIYIAIRRPMKTPESGTEVFGAIGGPQTNGFPTGVFSDASIVGARSGTDKYYGFTSRLTGTGYLNTTSTGAENSSAGFTWDRMTGFWEGSWTSDYFGWSFKRATGFFDVVAYSGSGSSPQNVTHNLTVTPEMMIVKYRDGATNWYVYHSALGNTIADYLDSNGAPTTSAVFWNDTSPTATQFTLGSFPSGSGQYIAYLFATLAGVSKVGSYTGTGSDLNVDCGFSAGARFILIKRTDSSGDWYVYDSVRGIVAGNDPYLLLNSTAAEVTNTDYIDPLSSGFTVTSSAPAALNASGGTYIFLAIS